MNAADATPPPVTVVRALKPETLRPLAASHARTIPVAVPHARAVLSGLKGRIEVLGAGRRGVVEILGDKGGEEAAAGHGPQVDFP